MLNKHFYMEN